MVKPLMGVEDSSVFLWADQEPCLECAVGDEPCNACGIGLSEGASRLGSSTAIEGATCDAQDRDIERLHRGHMPWRNETHGKHLSVSVMNFRTRTAFD
jgi:hypothetical protein